MDNKITTKLTPTLLALLRDVEQGIVFRSERGIDLYTCYTRTDGRRRKVTALVARLSKAQLIQIGPSANFARTWRLTEAGRLALSEGAQS